MKYLLAIASPLLLLQQAIIGEAGSCYKCGQSIGDPHMVSYDQEKFQCQGTGDFILSKSTNTNFELQGRFWLPDTLSHGRNGSSTVGAVLHTGVGNEAKIEVAVTPTGFPSASEHDCDIEYWIDGVKTQFNSHDVSDPANGFQFKRRTREHLDPNGNPITIPYRQFFMYDSKVIMWMSKGWDFVFGCHINFQLCIPCDFGETHDLVGLLGKPNNNKADDFMTRSGQILQKPTLNKQTDYCKENWCVPRTEDSLFLNPDRNEFCTAQPDEDVEQNIRDADEEIKRECEGEVDCITDTLTTGDIEIGKRTLEEEKDMREHPIDEEQEPDENDMVEEDPRPPTKSPTAAPTKNPTKSHTASPTAAPTKNPTKSPTASPTAAPTKNPTKSPTASPTATPTKAPTKTPTSSPTTKSPTGSPTKAPTGSPSATPTTTASASPTKTPTATPTKAPTGSPSATPTTTASASPTKTPTATPTGMPTGSPSAAPTTTASASPTKTPSATPTGMPTVASDHPSASPTTGSPTESPSAAPTGTPTVTASASPSGTPTAVPTVTTKSPTAAPSGSPTATTSSSPTAAPTSFPTPAPSSSPTSMPTVASGHPSASPTTGSPTSPPSASPSVAATTGSPTSLEPTSAPEENHVCGDLGSQSAYATSDSVSACFLDGNWKHWGWTISANGIHSGSYTYDVYAAAEKCNTSRGTVVGFVTVTYDAPTKKCSAMYSSISDYTIEEFHFYCGSTAYVEKLDLAAGTASVSTDPSDYSCVHDSTESATSDSCSVDNVEPDANGKIHVIAHVTSCTSFQGKTTAPTDAPEKQTSSPTEAPTTVPMTNSPTEGQETDAPEKETSSPTEAPTTGPMTNSPTEGPETDAPEKQTSSPTKTPTTVPVTSSPTEGEETDAPEKQTSSPTKAPTTVPVTSSPTEGEETDAPEIITAVPDDAPTAPSTEAPETETDAPETDVPETKKPETAAPTDRPMTSSPTKTPETPAPTAAPTKSPTAAPTAEPTATPTAKPEEKRLDTPPKTKKGSSSGDPHFKTWTGDKYDYHGECDLVLVDNPSFANGLGLKLHIRTTRVKYFSFIEKVALQIGSDVLEFDNDVENFLINGEKVEAQRKHHRTMFAGFHVRRDPKAISVRLADGTGLHQKTGAAKIDFHTRKNGFPAVIVDGGHTNIFEGSLGLLGEWKTGRRLARDGKTEMNDEDATDFALEWQVRDTEPMLFKDARLPQFPTKCTPPAKMPNRLGSSRMRQEAEEACAHWEDDKDDCLFDVMATRDVMVAQEGHIVHIE